MFFAIILTAVYAIALEIYLSVLQMESQRQCLGDYAQRTMKLNLNFDRQIITMLGLNYLSK